MQAAWTDLVVRERADLAEELLAIVLESPELFKPYARMGFNDPKPDDEQFAQIDQIYRRRKAADNG